MISPTCEYKLHGHTLSATLNPAVQNIPLSPHLNHLRPPPPRLSSARRPSIFIGIANYRDGVKCGLTVWTAFAHATYPEHVHIGVIDQILTGDSTCLEEYCKLALASWPSKSERCRYKSQITIQTVLDQFAKGPVWARAKQEALRQNHHRHHHHHHEDTFCLSIDAHIQFLYDWDRHLVIDWFHTHNEMAILSVYPMGYEHMGPNFTLNQGSYTSHLCSFLPRQGPDDIPRYAGILPILHSAQPQLSVAWAGGFNFGKCHAWDVAPTDPHLSYVFWGEEFFRGMQLWTRGYDFYSPSRYGHVVFHNWTDDPGKKK
jgi:hypothetical protein